MRPRSLPVMARLLVAAMAAGCSNPPPEALQLDGPMLTVHNATSEDWLDVKIYVNTHYRGVAPKIEAHGMLKAPLGNFVEAYGRRFNFSGMQIRSVRLTAVRPGGEPLTLDKQFQMSGLAGALGGKK